MYDAGKVIAGILIFLALVTLPFWYNAATGKADVKPQLQKPEGKTQCVADTDYMRAWHMDLLNTWRDEVVRDGLREYKGKDGKTYPKSLAGTCLDCHTKKSQFCDKCHAYAGVETYCWDCHVDPEVKN